MMCAPCWAITSSAEPWRMRQQLSSPSWKDSTFGVGIRVLTRRTVTESDCAKLDEFTAQSQGASAWEPAPAKRSAPSRNRTGAAAAINGDEDENGFGHLAPFAGQRIIAP